MPEIDPKTGERIQSPGGQIDPATGERIASRDPSDLTGVPGALPGMQTPQQAAGIQKPKLHGTAIDYGKVLAAGDVATGVGKGALHTISSTDQFAREHLPAAFTNSYFGFGKPANLQRQAEMATPQGTAQKIGYLGEQAGEFMLPGGAEEKLAGLAPKVIRPLAKIGTAALGAGVVNKAQGGEFGTGAIAGGTGAALGQGLNAVAPAIAEKALGIRGKFDRSFNKAPGLAALTETSGIRPETIANQARQRIGDLSAQVESKAAQSPGIGSLQPARDLVTDAQNKAIQQNAAGLHSQLNEMGNTLSRRFDTGQAIPANVPASELLNLRRGFSEEHGRWNPDIRDSAATTGRRAYGALTDEFHRILPEAISDDERISSLIPVKNRAQSIALNDNPLQKGFGRIAAHSGALAGTIAGGYEGRREGGIPGMIAGGALGLMGPELLASPEGQMALARSLYKARALRPMTGAALQFDRNGEGK